MLNNSDLITISSSLTKIGRKRLAEKNFDIKKVAFSDDGVNYALINDNLSDSDILVKRTPMLDVWNKGHLSLKNKILSSPIDNPNPNNLDRIQLSIIDTTQEVVDGKDIKFPTISERGGEILFDGYSSRDLSKKTLSRVIINNNQTLPDGVNMGFVTATLFDSTYFDIALDSRNISNYSSWVSRDIINGLDIKGLEKDSHNNLIFQMIYRGNPSDGATGSMLDRNFLSAFFIDEGISDNISKSINVKCMKDDGQNSSSSNNSFSIFYKGNFRFENSGIQKYETFIELLDEITGTTKMIRLIIEVK